MAEFFGVLLVFMIIGAIVALETKDLLASVISVGAVGFGVSVAFLFLGAPDIAITQVVVEVLTLVILIRATISRDLTSVEEERDFFSMTVGVAMLMLVFVFGVMALQSLPAFGHPVIDRLGEAAPATHYLRAGLKETGAANMVAAIILDYRGYDTLGEATVIFAAVIGALAILRSKARKKKEEAPVEE
ncbi:MAG: hydrogen gas-evolving membrane-bound hydrogenase subunit E [Verrucomicrobiota bacterium]